MAALAGACALLVGILIGSSATTEAVYKGVSKALDREAFIRSLTEKASDAT